MEMEKLGIKRVQTHGEKAAAYMADAYARIKRGPGLCMAQSVGAVNLAAGLQDARLACSPVIALTGRELQVNLLRHAYQEVDHVSPFSAVTKYGAHVAGPEQLPIHLRQAFRSATSGTPGPVHLDFEGITGQEVVDQEADLEVVIEETFAKVPAFRPAAEPEKIEEALKLLSRAERPVIVAGGGVTASDARAELVALAEKLSIPVATALNAKAMFPADHPLAVGTPGSYSRACANQALCEADLVFFVGSHAGGQVTHGYRIPPQGTPIIQLDINPEEIGRNYPVRTGMQGDARSTLRRMIEMAEAVESRSAWIRRVQELVRNWQESVSEVVNDNHSLNQEQAGVERTYGGRTAGSDELWLFEDADFAGIAESMGCLGITVNRPEELSRPSTGPWPRTGRRWSTSRPASRGSRRRHGHRPESGKIRHGGCAWDAPHAPTIPALTTSSPAVQGWPPPQHRRRAHRRAGPGRKRAFSAGRPLPGQSRAPSSSNWLDKANRADLIERARGKFGIETTHGHRGEAAFRTVPVPTAGSMSSEPRRSEPIAYARRAVRPYRTGPFRRILSSPRRRLGPGHDRGTFFAGLGRFGTGRPARQEACP